MPSSARRAAARSIDGVGSSAPVRVTCGPGRAREAFCAEDAEGSRKVQASAVQKKYDSLNRGPADPGLEIITKRRKDPSASHLTVPHCVWLKTPSC